MLVLLRKWGSLVFMDEEKGVIFFLFFFEGKSNFAVRVYGKWENDGKLGGICGFSNLGEGVVEGNGKREGFWGIIIHSYG